MLVMIIIAIILVLVSVLSTLYLVNIFIIVPMAEKIKEKDENIEVLDLALHNSCFKNIKLQEERDEAKMCVADLIIERLHLKRSLMEITRKEQEEKEARELVSMYK